MNIRNSLEKWEVSATSIGIFTNNPDKVRYCQDNSLLIILGRVVEVVNTKTEAES